MPPAHSVNGLKNLPLDVVRDAAIVNQLCGSLWAFVYLYNTTDATFAEVKTFCAEQGWGPSCD